MISKVKSSIHALLLGVSLLTCASAQAQLKLGNNGTPTPQP